MGKRNLSRRQSWRIEKIQQERTERMHKRAQKAEQTLNASDLGPEESGLVIAHYGTQLEIESLERPGELYRCHLRANLPALVTGDAVVWRAGQNHTGVVVAQQKRRSLLQRPDSRGQLKPVAANIDYIVIVIAPKPWAHANLIDRYLVAAEAIGIEPVLLLNKIDLLKEQDPLLDVLARYEEIGYRILHASTTQEQGLEPLKRLLDEHTSVFVGQSGVGKSSLVNALLPGIDTRVGALSDATGKGTHTTTSARLFHFPAGGRLIDSPGIREFGLWHIDYATLLHGFREFRPFIGACKFRDCKHDLEPGCALRQALEQRAISPERMASFQQIAASIIETR